MWDCACQAIDGNFQSYCNNTTHSMFFPVRLLRFCSSCCFALVVGTHLGLSDCPWKLESNHGKSFALPQYSLTTLAISSRFSPSTSWSQSTHLDSPRSESWAMAQSTCCFPRQQLLRIHIDWFLVSLGQETKPYQTKG